MDSAQPQPARWYYGLGPERKGPYAPDQLVALAEAGALTAQTLVWTDGMATWLPLGQTELAGTLAGTAQGAGQAVALPSARGAALGGAYDSAMGYAMPQHSFGLVRPLPYLHFWQAVGSCFRKYVDFSGRATRGEFWLFCLFCYIASELCAQIDRAINIPYAAGTVYGQSVTAPMPILGGLLFLAIFLPSLAVTARRLHDTDRSAWWLLLSFVPVIGWIVLTVFCVQRSDPGFNRFG